MMAKKKSKGEEEEEKSSIIYNLSDEEAIRQLHEADTREWNMV